MKSFFFFALLTPLLLSSQEHVRIQESEFSGFTNAKVNVIQVDADLVTQKALMDHWHRFLKAEAEQDVVRTGNELHTKKFPFKTISDRAVNVYMHFEELENGTRSYIAFEDSTAGFITITDPDYGIAIKKKIYEETHKVYVDAAKDQIKMEKGHLSELESIYEKRMDEKDKSKKKILRAEQEIDRIRNDMTINEGVLSELAVEVADQRSELNAMGVSTPEELRKRAKKELAATEKKRSKMRKQIDKDREKIHDLETDIRSYQYTIEKLEPLIDSAKKKVDEQRAIVTQLEENLYKKEHIHH